MEKSNAKHSILAFSVAGSLFVTLFLVLINLLYSHFPWVLFCIPGVMMWPLSVWLRGRLGRVRITLAITLLVGGYYAALNILAAPGYPWAVFVGLALVWYPAVIALAKKGAFALSAFGLAWSIPSFCVINLLTSPHTIWAVYPIFAVIWWPLSVYFFCNPKKLCREI
ncbi:MAG: hypothetical protein LBS96_06725 [Oscillospiraceae bacterium]|nr:hypothetical protein [Oscillospiraceae bacterium]